jgi:glycosyltransferase involved in cell wall biosynthesis
VRITYWTSAPLEPDIEAVSKEVLDLATHFGRGPILAINRHLTCRWDWARRSFGVGPNLSALLRVAAPVVEAFTDVNHVYAEVTPWVFFTALTRKPIVMTIASEKGEVNREFLDRCSAIVVQTESMRRKLQACNVGTDKVRLIYPGIDLPPRVSRAKQPRAHPRILFATFPRNAEELEGRGVSLLLETARLFPHLQLTLLSRPWSGGSSAQSAVETALTEMTSDNVILSKGVQTDMNAVYREHDFTIVPYTAPDGGKECPRSLVESLACGVPVLVSEVAPFSEFVSKHACGMVFRPTPDGLAAAVEDACRSYAALSDRAVECAHQYFDRRATLRDYEAIYCQVAA